MKYYGSIVIETSQVICNFCKDLEYMVRASNMYRAV